jgi:hypothetical protein
MPVAACYSRNFMPSPSSLPIIEIVITSFPTKLAASAAARPWSAAPTGGTGPPNHVLMAPAPSSGAATSLSALAMQLLEELPEGRCPHVIYVEQYFVLANEYLHPAPHKIIIGLMTTKTKWSDVQKKIEKFFYSNF